MNVSHFAGYIAGLLIFFSALFACDSAETKTVVYRTKPITFVNTFENGMQLMSVKKTISINAKTLLNSRNASAKMIKKATVDSIILSIDSVKNFDNIANLSLSFYPSGTSKLKMTNVASSGKPENGINTYSFVGSNKKNIAPFLKSGEFIVELNALLKKEDSTQFSIDAVLVFSIEAALPNNK